MKTLKRWLVAGGMASLLCIGAANAPAQADSPRPKFDAAQIQQLMLERIRSVFEIKEDDEWNVISVQVTKVFEAATKARAGSGGAGMARLFRRPGQDGQDGGGAPQGGRRGGTAGLLGGPDPDADALQKVIDSNGSNAELKAAVARFTAARKEKQAQLEKAQAGLRELLSVRQEAIAISLGLL